MNGMRFKNWAGDDYCAIERAEHIATNEANIAEHIDFVKNGALDMSVWLKTYKRVFAECLAEFITQTSPTTYHTTKKLRAS